MKFYPSSGASTLHPQLMQVLAELRARRHFDVELYLRAKTRVINEYMRSSRLDTCVIAVSGGVDSAVVLALLHAAAQVENSPIKSIVPLALPVFEANYASNQDTATARAHELIKQFELTAHVIDLTRSFQEFKKTLDQGLAYEGQAWASGQLVSYLRTPAIYYATSLLTELKRHPIVCGTTNRDEGAYLGYFGKASDGMVDLQVISDVHKSEVYRVGHHLNVPESILRAVPTGDMYDGRVDEDVFGASYDFVELFLLLKALPSALDRASYLSQLTEPAAQLQYATLSEKLEALHRYNQHKYLGKSPAVHLDVLESGVPGGWTTGTVTTTSDARNSERFVHAFSLPKNLVPQLHERQAACTMAHVALPASTAYQLNELFSQDECAQLLSAAEQHGWRAVGQDGILAHYQDGAPIGSWRASTFNPELALLLWKRCAPHLPMLRLMQDNTPTDWGNHALWRPIGINPLFRFIKYTEGGLLIPHYDAPYQDPAGPKSLMSVIIYLANSHAGEGATRFIKDAQLTKPLSARDYRDWERPAGDDDILLSITPKPGAALIFDHRILHDAATLPLNATKIILRTDVVFTPCSQT